MAAGQQIRIRLKGFDHRVLDKSSTEIVETVSVPAAAWLARFRYPPAASASP